jgi:type II secretory pathway pseudopilin PulG
MRQNHKAIKNTAKQGVTLLELTVVILVLLLLIGILFIGVQGWKRGADRSVNILNLRNSQQAMRSYANVHNVAEGGDVPQAAIFGPTSYLPFPDPVATVTYSVPVPKATPVGVLYLRPSADGAPAPRATPTLYGPYIEDIISWW